MTATQISIRQLSYSDLPQVIAIERQSFPTPWSLAMFVLELSKTSGVCLAAVERDPEQASGRASSLAERGRGRGERLLGYLVCSRYDQVWPLMNVAAAPEARRRGVGALLLEEMLDRAGRDSSYTLEVRTSNA